MRHLRSILYALVLAPAVWILCGVGFDQDLTGRARDNGGIESLSGVLLLVLAGAAYAILLLSPISPAGPLLTGLVFIGIGAWARIAPASYAGVWPGNVASDGFDVSTPGYGLAVLLAVPLLSTALSARRWRAFEPPEILFVGTIGRARGAAQVAGPQMASEQTTVIPQQRPVSTFVPGFGESSSDATQVVVPARAATTQPVSAAADDGDGSASGADEATQMMAPAAGEATEVLGGADDRPTQDIAASEDRTRDVTGSAAGPHLAGDETTRDVTVGATTDNVTGDETTRLVPTAVAGTPEAGLDGDEKTQLLTPPQAGSHGEQTQVVRTGTVQPPGDRTQLLTFSAPAEAPTVATALAAPDRPADEESTTAMSIVAAERPDPGEDPTTRLSLPVQRAGDDDPTTRLIVTAQQPGAATTRADGDRPARTVTGSERPADEAADDTRPLTLPAPRPPADDATRRL